MPVPSIAGLGDEDLEQRRLLARTKIRKAVEFAESSPEPDVKDILEGVYA